LGQQPPNNVAQQIGSHDAPIKSVGFLQSSNLVVTGGWDAKLKVRERCVCACVCVCTIVGCSRREVRSQLALTTLTLTFVSTIITLVLGRT
jgi:hypothetical protein